MIIVFKPDASEQDIEHVVDRLRSLGLKSQVTKGRNGLWWESLEMNGFSRAAPQRVSWRGKCDADFSSLENRES